MCMCPGACCLRSVSSGSLQCVCVSWGLPECPVILAGADRKPECYVSLAACVAPGLRPKLAQRLARTKSPCQPRFSVHAATPTWATRLAADRRKETYPWALPSGASHRLGARHHPNCQPQFHCHLPVGTVLSPRGLAALHAASGAVLPLERPAALRCCPRGSTAPTRPGEAALMPWDITGPMRRKTV